jgi:hypothetical protein
MIKLYGKHTVLLLFFVFTTSAYSQSFAELQSHLKQLENNNVFTFDTTGFSSLPVEENYCSDEINSNYYHVVDLNADGLNDLLFSGPCKPYNRTIIYLNNGRELYMVDEFAGKILSIKKDSALTTITIFKEACCCDYFSELIELSISPTSGLTVSFIYFHTDTKISLGSTFESIKINGIIRSTPVIDNKKKKDACRNQKIIGNKWITLDKPTEVVQLNKVGKWSLVYMREDSLSSYIGWIETKE